MGERKYKDIDTDISKEYSEDMSLPKLRNYSREPKTKALIFRVNSTEDRILKEKAAKYTGGNYSDFLRHAILRWEPELTDEEKAYADDRGND